MVIVHEKLHANIKFQMFLMRGERHNLIRILFFFDRKKCLNAHKYK